MKAVVRVLIAVLAVVVAGVFVPPVVSARSVAAPAASVAVMVPGVAGSVVSVPPARVVDSRIGLQIPGAVSAVATVGVQVAGRGGIPSSGVATVTVTGPQGGGYVTVWPAGTARPGTSNLNFQVGQTIANTVLIRVGTGGRVELFNGSFGTVRRPPAPPCGGRRQITSSGFVGLL